MALLIWFCHRYSYIRIGQDSAHQSAPPVRGMHEALTIVELQSSIIDYILSDDAGGRSTVAALARTCKVLHGSAAKALWQDLPSLAPLLYCMPSDILGEKKAHDTVYLDFRRPIQTADYARASIYTSHVRSLHFQSSWKRCNSSPLPSISPEAFAALAANIPADCLLPNLRSLTWDPPYGEDGPAFLLIEKLLTRTLTSLTLRILTKAQAAAPPILQSIPQRCPWMRSLFIEYEGTDRAVSESVAQCISQLHRLQECEVYIPALSVSLNSLVKLPNLRSLTAWQCPTLPSHPRSRLPRPTLHCSPGTFPALQEIHVRTEHITACTTLARLISSKQIRSITFTYSEWAPASLLEDCTRAISSQCDSASLTSLSIAFDREAGTPYGISDAVVDETVLRPLLVFSSLEALELDPHCSFAIDDRLVEDLSTHWPRLRSLELIPKKPIANASRLTLQGLIPLVKNCPDLKTLCVPLEDFVMTPSLEPASTIFNEKVTSLAIMSTAVENLAAAILFLVYLFPNLRAIDNWAEDEDEESLGPWRTIETLVRDINSAFPKETQGHEGRFTQSQLRCLMRKWLKEFGL